MKFHSTRSGQGDSDGLSPSPISLGEAIFRGLAPDGGLYIPTEEPDLRSLIRSFGSDTSFVDLSAALIQGLFPHDYSAATARALALKAFPFEPRLQPLEDGLTLLELFHGPSFAFKDFGASFLAATMDDYLATQAKRAVIVTATSGDTGSAVAQAFHGLDHVDVVILYPSGRVSPLQEQQLTTLGGNIQALEVAGSFDDCQRMVKEAFADASLTSAVNLTSANSINVGRLIPQSFYYIYAFAQLKESLADELVFVVPSGNFGNLTAGVLAWRWGMPASGFVAATNANDVVPQYLKTGLYHPRASVKTLANAMDVGNPSNFERLQAIFRDLDIASVISGHVVSDQTIAATMRDVHHEHGMFVCPHTATGIHAARSYREANQSGDLTMVSLATAHPAKFTEVSHDVMGIEPRIPERLQDVMKKQKQALKVEPKVAVLSEILRDRYAG